MTKKDEDHNILLDAPERPHEALPAEHENDKRVHRVAWAMISSRWQMFKYNMFQQRLPATIAILTPRNSIGFLLLLGAICLAYGIALLVGSLQIQSYSVEYTSTSGAATVNIPITSDMSTNTYIYIKFQNVYLNTKDYTSSLDTSQLEDGVIAAGSSDCSPWEESYYPCGLIAASAFTDTFVFRLQRDSTTTFLSVDESADTIVSPTGPTLKNPSTVSDSDFWIVPYFPPTVCQAVSASDATPEFTVNMVTLDSGETSVDCTSTSCNFTPTCSGDYAEVTNPAGWGMENSHFQNWMSTPATPFFSKLWAKVEEPLYAGDVIVVDLVGRWSAGNGKKFVQISEINWQGGRSDFLGASLIAVGAAYIIGALIILREWRRNPRVLGDHDRFKFASTIKHKGD